MSETREREASAHEAAPQAGEAPANAGEVAWQWYCDNTLLIPSEQIIALGERIHAFAVAYAAQQLEVADKIIAERDRVLDALPCPTHGRCVPHALEEVARLRSGASALPCYSCAQPVVTGGMYFHGSCYGKASDEIEREIQDYRAYLVLRREEVTDEINATPSASDDMPALWRERRRLDALLGDVS